MTLTQQLELIQTATSVEAIAPELPALVEEARLECIGDRPPLVLATLIQLLNHPQGAIVNRVSDSLEQLGSDAVVPLLRAFEDCQDQGIQARLVQILAKIGDERALDLFVDMVGAEIANHCQGNVRRIAARGLGQVLRSHPSPSQHQGAINKLIWAVQNPEDWALRYAAALSLAEIATDETLQALKTVLQQEQEHPGSSGCDPIVQQRIERLLLT
ncbi:hypothetical protein AY600_08280 [Phormidium willei BDU 130791]|nr:hypothetical protein AY600_08280 [Phormidium willei BDU 130791]TAO03913.1 MAG: HEAT repeat domain-containing protein [Phormidium sp. SL48-SHIP]